MKRTITLVIGLVISGSLVGFLVINSMLQGGPQNFQECKDRGFPVQESFPEACVTPEGKRFVNTSQQ